MKRGHEECSPSPPSKTRKIRGFQILHLPTDILLYCLSFAVESYTDVLALTRVSRDLQETIRTNDCDFRHVRVHLSDDNVGAIATVYPFWDNFIINGSLSPLTLPVVLPSLRSVFLLSACSRTIMDLAQAPRLRQLTINSAGHCDVEPLRMALPALPQLETLSIRYITVCPCLAAALPSGLRRLSARRISSNGASAMPLLPRLTRLRLTAFCEDARALSAKCPSLRKYYIQQYGSHQRDSVMEFALFRQLLDLQFSAHGCYTVPLSLTTLATFQSNALLGPLPRHLQQLTLLQKKGLPLLTEQLDRLCSLPSLMHVSVSDVQPSTLQQLSLLPRFESFQVTYGGNLNLLQFPLRRLRALTINNCDDARLFYQVTAMESLVDLTIVESRVSQIVVHNLLKALPQVTEFSVWGCANIDANSLRANFPGVMIDYMA